MFNKYINFFLLSKKILTKPKEKKILIFDEDDAEIISKYFNSITPLAIFTDPPPSLEKTSTCEILDGDDSFAAIYDYLVLLFNHPCRVFQMDLPHHQ